MSSVRRLLLRLLLGRRQPLHRGDVRVPGLAGPVVIRRDKYGIPHIEADRDADAAFATGFCQGQDRGFQLEVLARVGRGTLGELVGPGGLPADRMSRRVGFRRAADAQVAVLAPHIRGILDAFAAGVNAAHAHGMAKPPHEFAILGGKPTAWHGADVLAVLKLMSFGLPSNWDVELARLRLLRADGPEAVRALDPLAAAPSSSPGASAALDALAADLAAFQQVVPRGGGSNAWAVSGSRTLSGKPLLASDPHLAGTLPAPWYLLHVRTPEWEVAGAALAGSPGVVIGHNGFCAWGVTAGLTDNTDLFLETLSADGRSARNPDGTFTPCEVLRETIRVKGKPDHIEEVLVTPRGPVISPLATGVSEAVSMRAVWLDPLPLRGFLDVPRVRSFDQFRAAFEQWPVLPLCIVYADETGEIGFQFVGQLPVRESGTGTFPLPADALGARWKPDLLPFAAMPFEMNPPAGFVATANEPPPPSPTGGFLGADFLDPFRVNATRDALTKQDSGWTVAAMQLLQQDVRSLPWELIRDSVLSVAPTSPEAGEALDLLRGWDGNVSPDSPAASVFELFVAELCVRVAKAKAPTGWAWALGGDGEGRFDHSLFADRRIGHLARLLRTQPAGWFARPWADEIGDALASVVLHLRLECGPSPRWWTWGNVRPLTLKHIVFGGSKLLGPLFNLGPVAFGGDANTICQAAVNPLRPRRNPHIVPNLRAVIDCDNWSASRFAMAGGQSGNVLSEQSDDLYRLWLAGEGVPIAWTPDQVLRTATDTLRLTPLGEPGPQGPRVV